MSASESMKALVFDGERAAVAEHAEPDRQEGGAIVRTVIGGICNTDLEIVRGYMGFTGILGHELVGVVEDGPPDMMGKRVTAEINFACGNCDACARSLGRHCPNRSVMGILDADGAFAERVAVPIENLHTVPDAVTDEAAVFVEPLAAAFEILEQVGAPTEAVVLGDGKLGLLVAFVLKLAGARIELVGKHPAHLDIARERGIATTLLEAWDRTPRDLVVDATGNADGFKMAVAATRPRGTLVLKSTVAGETPAVLAPIVINEISVVGSRCGPFRPAIAALADRSIDPRPMIAGEFALDDAEQALEKARGALKVLLRP